MNRLILATTGILLLGSGSALAASCPAAAPPVIKFVPLPSDVARDTSKTAKELGATSSSPGPLPVRYERDLSGSSARAVAVQKLPDGTVCASLQEVDFKLGYKRKIDIATEFAENSCVADTMADYETPVVKSDDAVLAAFGATIPQAYAADVNAIGSNAGKDQDDAQKPLLQKISALLNDKLYPAFEQQVAAATPKIDMTKWQKASCDGATDKAFASISIKPEALTNNKDAQMPASQNNYGGRGMH
jgi:hypothetical protein